MEQWPTSLPQMPGNEFTTEHVAGLADSEDEQSSRRTRTYPEIQVKFLFRQCSTTQMQAVRTFFSDTLNQNKPWNAPWLASTGFSHHFLRFANPPTIARNGWAWDITLDVSVVSGVPVDAEDAITYGED